MSKERKIYFFCTDMWDTEVDFRLLLKLWYNKAIESQRWIFEVTVKVRANEAISICGYDTKKISSPPLQPSENPS